MCKGIQVPKNMVLSGSTWLNLGSMCKISRKAGVKAREERQKETKS